MHLGEMIKVRVEHFQNLWTLAACQMEEVDPWAGVTDHIVDTNPQAHLDETTGKDIQQI